MTRLREIPRTASFAWSPGSTEPYLATGTRAGAVDADFSSDTQLELWRLDLGNNPDELELKPAAAIETDSRFHDIAWVQQKSVSGRGIIAGGLENGSLDLWSVDKLLKQQSDALISRTTKHSGAIKSLQFNPSRSELLATAGAKGELYISDLNNLENPFRLGNTAGRADDFECLDWNKRVAHIMVTGSSGGFVTVWDVKAKKESLTLNNYGRKPVSAVAWDPEKPTRLITAVPLDTDPLILVWDLRNSNAPEKILTGHEGGVLSLSWCEKDSDLLLSCGKDNRTLCWNPQSGEQYGEFPVVKNWTFQTGWNPHNPNILATASFDGKISVQTIQNTRKEAPQGSQSAPLDGEDFFAKAASQPQASSFSLSKPPKWLERPTSVSFGFGGKVVSLGVSGDASSSRQSTIKISNFAADEQISTLAEAFTKTMKEEDLAKICQLRVAESTGTDEENDWKTIETLLATNPRRELINSLGFSDKSTENHVDGAQAATDGSSGDGDVQTSEAKDKRLSSFFDKADESDGFLADLASTKGAKTNNPFNFYPDSESTVDKQITDALILGQFDKAMETCLAEDRLSDAFMIAVCGGQSSIEKVQKAYFKKQSSGPKYLRLLASVVGKSLWDVVYNADLSNWKEVMATLCTYASAEEFPDLCEGLGDRLEEEFRSNPSDQQFKRSASFCYIAGSKLEKVLGLWLEDLASYQKEQLDTSGKDTSFSIHARALQAFIEKVTIFREVTKYQDSGRSSTENWKLESLYEKYSEYADIVASQGQLEIASKYLDLLPTSYPAAELARNRVNQATRKAAPQKNVQQSQRPATNVLPRGAPLVPSFQAQQPQAPQSNMSANPYAPSQQYYQPADNAYNSTGYAPNQQPLQGAVRPMIPPPPSVGGPPMTNPGNAPPASNPPPPKASGMVNWNDTPEDFFKPPTSRRGTPSVPAQAVSVPFPGASPPVAGSPYGTQPPRQSQPAPPPPKGPAPPPRNMTPVSMQPPERPTSAAANTYAPAPGGQSLPPPQQLASHIPRGPSPYHVPPPSGPPPNSSRYAPTPSQAQANPQAMPPAASQRGPPPPNPYAAKPGISAPPSQGLPASGPPPTGPPRNTQSPVTSASIQGPPATKSTAPKHPPGDRSHIPSQALPVFELLNEDMQRVKAKAPASFKPQVNDTEKRLNILFDNLNNETLLKPNTVQDMVELSNAIRAKDYERAQSIHLDILTNRTDECGNWMTGVKRLIGMSKATP